jgi:hypothetical protein
LKPNIHEVLVGDGQAARGGHCVADGD